MKYTEQFETFSGFCIHLDTSELFLAKASYKTDLHWVKKKGLRVQNFYRNHLGVLITKHTFHLYALNYIPVINNF